MREIRCIVMAILQPADKLAEIEFTLIFSPMAVPRFHSVPDLMIPSRPSLVVVQLLHYVSIYSLNEDSFGCTDRNGSRY